MVQRLSLIPNPLGRQLVQLLDEGETVEGNITAATPAVPADLQPRVSTPQSSTRTPQSALARPASSTQLDRSKRLSFMPTSTFSTSRLKTRPSAWYRFSGDLCTSAGPCG